MTAEKGLTTSIWSQ
jgi:hypothetical protein